MNRDLSALLRSPARGPNLNAYAERFVRSIESVCLARVIPLAKRHLREAVTEYRAHYHFGRNHQGLNNQLIGKARDRPNTDCAVSCRERLGGVLKYYYRSAA
jgi:transposase InsO family protein